MKTPKPLQPKAKHPGGRPSKYNPEEMLPRLSEVGTVGGSKAEMAVALGISRDTFHSWVKQHPEFSDAVKTAELLSQAWWEKNGRQKTFDSNGFNATAFIFQMKNRFPTDWRDVKQTELTGADGGPVRVEQSPLNVAALDADEREALKALLLKAKGDKEQDNEA
jgi:hypothetical protein